MRGAGKGALTGARGALTRRRLLSRGMGLVGGGLALGALPACSIFESPPHVVRLTAAREFSPAPPVGWQLLVGVPVTTSVLNTSRVPLRQMEAGFGYFDAEWQDPLPEMLQGLLIESFEYSGRITGVAREGSGLRADYVLLTDIRDFQAEYPHSTVEDVPTVHVRVECKMVTLPRRTIQESQGFEIRVPAKGTGFTAVLAAYDEAFHMLARQVAEWALQPGRRAGGGV
ncbi:ABC-type transport auxiliary lipoprotein family protein [Nitrospirillum sp. BR 11828]|uniref:ABC-type transport auxiliary lipoprotein family protein n=1 Tax=Nitrospirillum sp. BR 11828 TaxID=3104325 RepID=UPI002ACA7A75|nr:ABC-type transport auxiliary lipoprotein family protein [Nitrospirillum sp. BR 11828]MDZ5647725.1 ABC-type transport auxiliary lipoprotein family protein [Nitrospirillum sp. BR 11828]